MWLRSSSELGGADARRDAVVGQQAQLVLGLGQGDPEPTPGAELALRSPQLGHRAPGVAGHQRIVVHKEGVLRHRQGPQRGKRRRFRYDRVGILSFLRG